jgi:hypothetical protein
MFTRRGLGGCVRTVRGTECVIHVRGEPGGKQVGEGGVVRLLLRVKAEVLEHHHLARLQAANACLNGRTNAVVQQLHRLTQQIAKAFRARRQRKVGNPLPLGTAEVGAHGNRGAVVDEVPDGGHRRANAGVVGDPPGVEGCVEVGAYKHALLGPRTAGRIHLDETAHYGSSFCARSTTRHE